MKENHFLDKKENLMLQVKYLAFDEFVEIESSDELTQRLFILIALEHEISELMEGNAKLRKEHHGN